MNKAALDRVYSSKQQDVLRFHYNNDYFILINHGAIRTGKTIIDNDLFLSDLVRVKNYAEKRGIIAPQYILAGASIGNIQKNVLSELTKKYGLEFKLDKFNRFKLFGVQVCCTGHDDIGQIRTNTGMTAYGAYMNEGALANKEVFVQIIKRCSADDGFNAHVIIDTNPREPTHYLKSDYIDKADGRRIKTFHWSLEDNPFLSASYKENIIATTPSGVFSDRDIKGLWVTADGIVYQDFDEKVHVIDTLPIFKRYFAGVDWGYEHKGSICLFGVTSGNDIVMIREITERHKLIDWWTEEALKLVKEFSGYSIPFYCDSARTEHITAFCKKNIRAIYANKSVDDGIEYVAKLYKTKRLYIYRPAIKDYLNEMYNYVWDEKTGQPVKQDDDVMDAMRYGLYTDSKFMRS